MKKVNPIKGIAGVEAVAVVVKDKTYYRSQAIDLLAELKMEDATLRDIVLVAEEIEKSGLPVVKKLLKIGAALAK